MSDHIIYQFKRISKSQLIIRSYFIGNYISSDKGIHHFIG